ncbi:MAG: hypothetical protein GF410_07190 [Chitinivibrionales bacterium]|nr:hypothetical protein [Chitinivibrionales bacterium]
MHASAALLIGHSHSGKSPLGRHIERAARYRPQRIYHLDFGELLRNVARGMSVPGLDTNDALFVRSILDGTLLDAKHFPIAGALLDWFLGSVGFDPRAHVLLLNGFPRTRAQAAYADAYGIAMRLLIHCDCSAESAWKRKHLAAAGAGHEDRGGRGDDDPAIFGKRIVSFEQDTLPLVEYYRSRGTPVLRIPVDEDTTPRDMYDAVSAPLEAIAGPVPHDVSGRAAP